MRLFTHLLQPRLTGLFRQNCVDSAWISRRLQNYRATVNAKRGPFVILFLTLGHSSFSSVLSSLRCFSSDRQWAPSFVHLFLWSRKIMGRDLLNSTLILLFLVLILTENNLVSNFFKSVFHVLMRTQQSKQSLFKAWWPRRSSLFIPVTLYFSYSKYQTTFFIRHLMVTECRYQFRYNLAQIMFTGSFDNHVGRSSYLISSW